MHECSELLFIFALVWSLGGNLNEEGRATYNNYLGKKVADYNKANEANKKELPPKEENRT